MLQPNQVVHSSEKGSHRPIITTRPVARTTNSHARSPRVNIVNRLGLLLRAQKKRVTASVINKLHFGLDNADCPEGALTLTQQVPQIDHSRIGAGYVGSHDQRIVGEDA